MPERAVQSGAMGTEVRSLGCPDGMTDTWPSRVGRHTVGAHFLYVRSQPIGTAMAARMNPKHDEATRQKIQTSQLINRLQSYINGEVKMETGQVTAALGLLKKSLPDLASVQHSGEEGGPLKMVIEWNKTPSES